MSNQSDTLIRKHEGLRLRMYLDTEGVHTVGFGHNMDQGINQAIADFIFEEDMKDVRRDARGFDWFDGLNEARQAVVENMLFNLGLGRFSRFKKTIQAIKDEDWYKAADEMKNSKWYSQVGYRAVQLCSMMRLGEWTN